MSPTKTLNRDVAPIGDDVEPVGESRADVEMGNEEDEESLEAELLERGRKVVLDEKPRIQCKNGETIPLERTGSLFNVLLWIPKGFHRQG